MVPEGGSAKLVCKARGYPPPKIVWRREDGGDIISRGGPQGKTKGKYFLSLFKYRCKIKKKYSIFIYSRQSTLLNITYLLPLCLLEISENKITFLYQSPLLFDFSIRKKISHMFFIQLACFCLYFYCNFYHNKLGTIFEKMEYNALFTTNISNMKPLSDVTQSQLTDNYYSLIAQQRSINSRCYR